MMLFRLALAALVCTLAACATKDQARASSAATTPLSDLNLLKTEIPDVLQQAARQPYLPTVALDCSAIDQQVILLDDALGPDLDAPPSEADPTLLDRGTEAATNSAIGALQRTAEGLIPFRGWVRKLSGAERHSKHVADAIRAGTARRAFLKGVRAGKACPVAQGGTVAAATTATP